MARGEWMDHVVMVCRASSMSRHFVEMLEVWLSEFFRDEARLARSGDLAGHFLASTPFL